MTETTTPTIYTTEQFKQGSVDWRRVRSAKITSTTVKLILVDGTFKYGFGKAAIKAAKKIAMQRVTKRLTPDDEKEIHSFYLQRGKNGEPIARKLYQLERFVTVQQVAFVDCGRYGCSPDGLVDEDGIIEIKCYTKADEHFDAIAGENDKPLIQIQFHLFVTGRKWCDYVSYYPEAPEGNQLVIKRIYPDKLQHEIFKYKLEKFNKLVDEYYETANRNYLMTH